MDCIREYIEKHFSEKRRIHTWGVCETAKKLAAFYGVDADKAETAALFHDLYRGIPEQTLNMYVRQLGLDRRYLDSANLAHGKIAAVIMERDWGIRDADILNAVRYHTTGRAGMSELEKVIFLADAIEPNRQYPGVDALRAVAYDGLDAACLTCMEQTINYLEEQGLFLDRDTLYARDSLKGQKGEKQIEQ